MDLRKADMIFEDAYGGRSIFFLLLEGATASFISFLNHILIEFFAGILTDLLLAGFRPILAFLFTRTNFPIPGRGKESVSVVSETAGAATSSIIPEAVYRAR